MASYVFKSFQFKGEHSICLWNPTTKQSRVLLRSPSLYDVFTTVGFGFDVRNNDYKVVNLIARSGCLDEKRVEVYSLNTNSWKRVTTVPSFEIYGNPRMPFNNGTCFYWWGYDSTFVNIEILCFDFSSEIFHSISFPRAVGRPLLSNASVVSDKIACVFKRNDDQFEIWVLNEYGRVNESWAKLYTISLYTKIDWRMPIELLSMNGKYIFFKGTEQMCRFNVATKETKNLSTLVKPTETFTRLTFRVPWVEFKESLVSIGGGNSAPTGVYKDSGKVFKEE